LQVRSVRYLNLLHWPFCSSTFVLGVVYEMHVLVARYPLPHVMPRLMINESNVSPVRNGGFSKGFWRNSIPAFLLTSWCLWNGGMQPPVRSYGKFCSPAQNVWNSIPRQCFPPLKVSERQERDCSCLCSPGLTSRKSDARRRRMKYCEGTATVSHLTLENARLPTVFSPKMSGVGAPAGGCGSEMQIQTTLLWITTMQIQLALWSWRLPL